MKRSSSLTDVLASASALLEAARAIVREYEEDDTLEDDVARALGEIDASVTESLVELQHAQSAERQLQTILGAEIPPSFGMFTPDGDRLVMAKLDDLERRCATGEQIRGKLEGEVSRIISSIQRAGHPEVWDTAVREMIYKTVDDVCDALMWRRLYE